MSRHQRDKKYQYDEARQPNPVTAAFIVCPWCGHGDNPTTVSLCEFCNRSLAEGNGSSPAVEESVNRKSTAPSQQNFIFSNHQFRLGLLVFLATTVGGIWLWQNLPKKNLPNSSPPVSSHSSPPQVSSSAGSDIQLYASMQEVPNVPEGIFNYGGAPFFAALTKHGMNEAIARAHPRFRLRFTESQHQNPGSGTGIKMLLDGELSFASTGRPLEDAEYKTAKERNQILEQVPVALDGIVFFTHSDLSLPGLSIQQVRDIFLGKVRNWNELGGPNLPIVPLSLEPSATSSMKMLLGEQVKDIGPNVRIVQDYTTGIRQVNSTPGAIFFGAAGLVAGQQSVRPIALARSSSQQYVQPFLPNGQINSTAFRDGTYPLTRRLFVIFRRNDTPEEQAGVAYTNLLLSQEGQRIIKEAGFVPLY
jgi:phosphate transport system substrate-binding protein